ncbi:hypothetical protein J7T55_005351 [Diaporthe amygdali]|uniref:uncharacterized protein n=1 Tax=Phomopsis amygdali TaxID=1214568 RepID=UPI0022FE2539|nr:uncharacterized protein J7T55_005351 [Diaporthe amygdali]KAJ0108374.1 hypothetical protein J7T55_005351 [Diaporthe amygdali]
MALVDALKVQTWVLGFTNPHPRRGDGPGVDHDQASRLIARHRFCLVVDAECLKSLGRTGVPGEQRQIAVRAPLSDADGGGGGDDSGMTDEDREESEEEGLLDPRNAQAHLGHAHENRPAGDGHCIFVAANNVVSFYETLSRGDGWNYDIYRQALP